MSHRDWKKVCRGHCSQPPSAVGDGDLPAMNDTQRAERADWSGAGDKVLLFRHHVINLSAKEYTKYEQIKAGHVCRRLRHICCCVLRPNTASANPAALPRSDSWPSCQSGKGTGTQGMHDPARGPHEKIQQRDQGSICEAWTNRLGRALLGKWRLNYSRVLEGLREESRCHRPNGRPHLY